MKILFQGTAAAEGVPAFFCRCALCREAWKRGGKEIRQRAGSLIDDVLKIDFGPDTLQQMWQYGNNFDDVKAVLITHSHSDHLSHDIYYRHKGYANLLDDPWVLPCYGNEAACNKIKNVGEEAKSFYSATVMKPFEPTEIAGYTVTALQAVHMINRSESATDFEVHVGEKVYHRDEDCLFYLIEKDGKRLLYAHDTSYFTNEDFEFLAGKHLDLVSMDCTMAAMPGEHRGHMGFEDNLAVKAKLIEIGAVDDKTIFVANHFSHNGLVVYEEMEKLLPGFIISYDGLTIEF